MKNEDMLILGIHVDRLNLESVLEKIKISLAGQPNIFPIVTINPEIIIQAAANTAFKKILNSAYLRLPDGIGIVLAAKLLGMPISGRITGIELTKKLAQQAVKWHTPIGLIGGRPGVAIRAGECLSEANFGLKWWSTSNIELKIDGSEEKLQITNSTLQNGKTINRPFDVDLLIRRINDTHTSLLFCAFGAPKQEYFIDYLKKYQNRLNQPLVAIGIGGALDEIGGFVSPAPVWAEKIGLKWLWRLMHEPWRTKRQLRLVVFVWLVLLAWFRKAFLGHNQPSSR